MTPEEFDELVTRLEAEAQETPHRYRSKVFLLALLGYAYIALVFVVLLFLAALVIRFATAVRYVGIAWKLLLPLLVLMFYILRALWVKFPHPEGIELTRAQAKPLFDMAKQFRQKLKTPRTHSILLINDFNAGVAQVPRLGLFGWHKNYLLVGMPLMQALSLEEFRGVLAHEFGHLSSEHGRFSSWIYRVRLTWAQLMDTLEKERHWGASVFSGFLKWYVPFFDAYTFVLARAQEYEADREAADLVGGREFAEGLIRVNIIGAFLESAFWPALYKNADAQPEPPSSPFPDMAKAFRSEIKPEQEQEWLGQAIEKKTSSADTHPSLSDRLAALGEPPHELAPIVETAAQTLLGSNEEALCIKLAEQWRENIAASWSERHRYAQEAQQRLGLLEKKAENESLTLEEEWDRAQFTEEFRDAESALPLYQRVLALDNQHPGASFAVGRLTIQRNDSGAIDLIEHAMKLNHEYVIPGCEVIHKHLMSQGRTKDAERYANRAINQSAAYQAAGEERSTINSTDRFITHDLKEEDVRKICEQLEPYRRIGEARLVCKNVKHFPETPLYLLGIEPKSSWYKSISDGEAAELSEQLARELKFPGDFYVVVFTSKNKAFKKALQEVPYSMIYQRGKEQSLQEDEEP